MLLLSLSFDGRATEGGHKIATNVNDSLSSLVFMQKRFLNKSPTVLQDFTNQDSKARFGIEQKRINKDLIYK